MMRTVRFALAAATALCLARQGAAALFFSEDFDVDPTANWTVNSSGTTDTAANFFFDYSTAGIPSAPNSVGGTTRGLRLSANLTGGVNGGLSVSPTGKSFSGDYKLRFDWWANYNGPSNGGGSGSTNLSTYGIGTTGTSAQWMNGTHNSAWFAAAGDGGTTDDYRAYSPAVGAGTGYTVASGVYVTGSKANTDPDYLPLGGNSPPAAQVLIEPAQTSDPSIAGAPGFRWHDVVIEKAGNSITWTVSGVHIATLDASTFSLGGGNIFFGHSDINNGSSSDAHDVTMLFTLIDNVRVVPEPSSVALAGLAALGLLAARRRRA